MSFGIALQWVTLQGRRTRYADALDEAARLRTELADLHARDPSLPAPPDLHAMQGEPALLDWIAWARTHIDTWRTQAHGAARAALLRRLADLAPPAAPTAPTRAAPHPPAPGAARRERALRTARAHAEDYAHELDDTASRHVAAALADLAALPDTASPAAIRDARHTAERAVADAVAQARHRTAQHRARETTRAQAAALDTTPQQRRALLHAIDTAPDARSAHDHLHAARHAAARSHAARAAAAALTDIGCDVSDTTGQDLHTHGETTADLPQRPDCALRLRLTPHRLTLTLVRSDDTTPTTDHTHQQWFCDTLHDPLLTALHNAAPQLAWHEKLRLEPGDRPLPRTAPPAHRDPPPHPRTAPRTRRTT